VQNPLVKAARALHESGSRKEKKELLVEGVHLIDEAIAAGVEVKCLFTRCSESLSEPEVILQKRVLLRNIPVHTVSEAVLQKISQSVTPQGVVAWISMPPWSSARHLSGDMKLLVADRLQDPGNMGTIIRLAKAFAMDALVVVPGTVDPYNYKVIRASMGAVFSMNILHYEEALLLTELEQAGIPLLVTASEGGCTIWDADLNGSWALVIGNESSGVSAGFLHQAQQVISIPMPGGTQSLNAATATAVVLYEAARQHRVAGGS